jgi:putative transposase
LTRSPIQDNFAAMKKPKQLEFKKVGGWSGYRRGAGRPNRSQTVNHMRRPRVDFSKPLHITQKLKSGIPSLRRKDFERLFHGSLQGAKEAGLHVIQYSLQHDHIHMVVEVANNKKLRAGMYSLASSFARALQKKMGLTGGIFKGSFHMVVITSPTQMKRVLTYVLLNYCKHSKMLEHLDPFSSGRFFVKWRELLGRKRWNPVLEWEIQGEREDAAVIGLSPPQSWLARQGWLRAG